MYKIENMTSTTMARIQIKVFNISLRGNISMIRGLRFATTSSDHF